MSDPPIMSHGCMLSKEALSLGSHWILQPAETSIRQLCAFLAGDGFYEARRTGAALFVALEDVASMRPPALITKYARVAIWLHCPSIWHCCNQDVSACSMTVSPASLRTGL